MTKALICPGFAKSGTTLLHALLATTDRFLAPKAGKEIYFFLHEQKSSFEHCFCHQTDDKVLLDISPPYLSGATFEQRRLIAQRIKSLNPQAKILIAIRHPLTRAISHYLHLIQTFARFGDNRYRIIDRELKKPYGLAFEQAVVCDAISIGDTLYESIEIYHGVFGKENVMYFFLETDTVDFGRFFGELCEWLGVSEPINRGWKTLSKAGGRFALEWVAGFAGIRT